MRTLAVAFRLSFVIGLGLAASHALAQKRIAIHGVDAIGAELMPALIQGFADSRGFTMSREFGTDDDRELIVLSNNAQPVLELELEQRDAAGVFQGMLESFADIGVAARRVADDEAEAIEAAQRVDLRDPASEQVAALDGVAVVVAKVNPLAFLRLSDLARVFSGQIANWADLGQSAAPIRLHAPAEGAPLAAYFNEIILEPQGLALSPTIQRHDSHLSLAQAVNNDPFAIGLVSPMAASLAKPTPIALDCGVLVGPDAFSMKAEEYPLTRRLYLYAKGERASAEAQALIDYARSDAAQDIVAGLGLVDQSLTLQDGAAYGLRVVNAMAAAGAATAKDDVRRFVALSRIAARLSTTFRFADGATLIDAKALADAGRLAHWLEAPDNADLTVTLAGFASAGEDAGSLSLARAEAARRALLVQVSPTFDASRVKVDSFGAVAPVACDDDAGDGSANRRVEVWVTP